MTNQGRSYGASHDSCGEGYKQLAPTEPTTVKNAPGAGTGKPMSVRTLITRPSAAAAFRP